MQKERGNIFCPVCENVHDYHRWQERCNLTICVGFIGNRALDYVSLVAGQVASAVLACSADMNSIANLLQYWKLFGIYLLAYSNNFH